MKKKSHINKRGFLRGLCKTVLITGLTGVAGYKIINRKSNDLVWQIDPLKCTQCGRCATECVLSQSAVKCVHNFSMCGYCKLCFGYFQPGSKKLTSSAENQLCPTGAIKRKYVENPYFEYTIDEKLCNGCAKCVKGCTSFGNGSLFLQVDHDSCLNCNECSIAIACPAGAYKRISQSSPYIKKGQIHET